MDTLMHADVFFFISSIGFIILFIVLIIALCFLISLFRSIRRITLRLEENVDNISEDAKNLIEDIRNSIAFRFLFGVKKRGSVRHTSKKVQ